MTACQLWLVTRRQLTSESCPPNSSLTGSPANLAMRATSAWVILSFSSSAARPATSVASRVSRRARAAASSACCALRRRTSLRVSSSFSDVDVQSATMDLNKRFSSATAAPESAFVVHHCRRPGQRPRTFFVLPLLRLQYLGHWNGGQRTRTLLLRQAQLTLGTLLGRLSSLPVDDSRQNVDYGWSAHGPPGSLGARTAVVIARLGWALYTHASGHQCQAARHSGRGGQQSCAPRPRDGRDAGRGQSRVYLLVQPGERT